MTEPVFWLTGFPLPPSTNRQLSVLNGQKLKTREARVFDRAVEMMRLRNEKNFIEISKEMTPYLRDYTLRVDIFIVLHSERVFTKTKKAKDWVKIIDHLNFDKAAKDALAKCLKIDDKFFFAGQAEKIACDHKHEEQIIFRISLHKPRTLAELKHNMKLEEGTHDGLPNH